MIIQKCNATFFNVYFFLLKTSMVKDFICCSEVLDQLKFDLLKKLNDQIKKTVPKLDNVEALLSDLEKQFAYYSQSCTRLSC